MLAAISIALGEQERLPRWFGATTHQTSDWDNREMLAASPSKNHE
jgi:hypothetical protein